jgi:REP element-mobilizing transposase RayT
MKQLKLFQEKIRHEFSGSLLKGKRKSARPLDSRKPIHLVFKATTSLTLLKNRKKIEEILFKYAKDHGIKIQDCGIHADHLHLAITIPNRVQYIKWVRATTSVLVQKIQKLKWKLRPYTRITEWGQAYQKLKRYIWKNREEGNLILFAENCIERFYVDQYNVLKIKNSESLL